MSRQLQWAATRPGAAGVVALCLVGWLATPVQPARLLVVPLASESHVAAFVALTTELEAHGGHEISMVVPDALAGTAAAMASARRPGHSHRFLTYPFRADGAFADDMARIAKAHPIVAMRLGYKILAAMTEMVLQGELLASFKELAPDLVIGDATASYGHWLGSLLRLPSVEFDVGTSSGLLHAGHYGGQFNPSYVPASGTFYPSTGMTLAQRCVNTAHVLAVKALMHVHRDWGPIRSLADRHGVPHLPGRGPHKPLLLLVNFDWALEPARPVAPSTKYLGALMPRPPAPLPEHIASWIRGGDAAAEAQPPPPVVLVSFGASFLLPEAAAPALAAALAAAAPSMRFIVRAREPEQRLLRAALAALGAGGLEPRQLLVLEAVPQNDLLGHPEVAAFVTQGGYLSIQEAAWHGVPIVGVPLMIGQGELVQHAADHGRGLVVPKERLLAGDASELTQALLAVVGNSSFRRQAAVTAARVRAHPDPGQQAATWVAYTLAAAPEAGSFLHTQGQDMRWWQVVLLDVLAVYALAASLAGWMLLQAGRLAAARLRRRGDGAVRAGHGAAGYAPARAPGSGKGGKGE